MPANGVQRGQRVGAWQQADQVRNQKVPSFMRSHTRTIRPAYKINKSKAQLMGLGFQVGPKHALTWLRAHRLSYAQDLLSCHLKVWGQGSETMTAPNLELQLGSQVNNKH